MLLLKESFNKVSIVKEFEIKQFPCPLPTLLISNIKKNEKGEGRVKGKLQHTITRKAK